MRIFKATVEDVPRILPLSIQYTDKIQDMPLDAEHWLDVWCSFLSSGTGVIYLQENDKNEIVGGIGGIYYPDLLTNRKTTVELFWYVDENTRGGGLKLYFKLKQWAKDHLCKRLAMIYLPDSMPEKLKTFYEREGGFLREYHYEIPL